MHAIYWAGWESGESQWRAHYFEKVSNFNLKYISMWISLFEPVDYWKYCISLDLGRIQDSLENVIFWEFSKYQLPLVSLFQGGKHRIVPTKIFDIPSSLNSDSLSSSPPQSDVFNNDRNFQILSKNYPHDERHSQYILVHSWIELMLLFPLEKNPWNFPWEQE